MDQTAAITSTETAAVDLMGLLGRCLGNIELASRVLAKFHETGRHDLDELDRAVHASDWKAAENVAHRFKGAASNISAVLLQNLAGQAERLSREQSELELCDTLAQLRDEWTNFERYADAFAPSVRAQQSCGAGQSI